MNQNLKSEDIDFVLSDVDPEHYFITRNGEEIKSMQDMADRLSQMDEETFNHHANEEKNDFSNWIQDVVKDRELAQEIKDKGKTEAADEIASKVKRLNKVKEHLKVIEDHEKKAFDELENTVKSKGRNPIHDYVYGIIIGTVTGLLLGSLL